MTNNKIIHIFGAGISGCTLARLYASKGYKVNLYEKKGYVGGNCYDFYDKHGVLVHLYGPHIFHTNNEDVFNFIKDYTTLNSYKNKVLVNVKNKLIPLPINFTSIKVIDPVHADEIINILKEKFPNQKTITIFDLKSIDNEHVKSLTDFIFANVYANYSSKMWGVKFEEINPAIINRVKVCLDYESDYFPEDKYQGLPVDGYTKMIENIIKHENINLILNSQHVLSIKDNQTFIDNELITQPIFYCGPIDELFNYQFGQLPYRSLQIKFETHNVDSFQQVGVVNYPADPTMTRITEYKKMSLQNIKNITTISKEYPGQFDLNSQQFNTRYYPIVNEKNTNLYCQYQDLAKQISNLHLIGRLAEYKYYDMDDAIISVFDKFKKINKI